MDSKNELRKIVTGAPQGYNNKPLLAIKRITKNSDGSFTLDHSPSTKHVLFTEYEMPGIIAFSQFMKVTEKNPYVYLLQTGFNEGFDLKQPQYQRKNITSKQPKETVTLKESVVPFFILDIDKFEIAQDIHTADIPFLIHKMIVGNLPSVFHNVSCYYHLSSSCGLNKSKTISCHIFFYLENLATNQEIKRYVQHHIPIADQSLYNAAHALYIADPIFPSTSDDPFPNNRSGLIRLDKDSLDIDFNAEALQFETRPKIKKQKINKPLGAQKHQPSKILHHTKNYTFHANSFKEWLSLAKILEQNLNIFILHFAQWVAKAKPFGLTSAKNEKILKALKDSPRCKREPGRYKEVIRGEYSLLMERGADFYQRNRIPPLPTIENPKPFLVLDNEWVNFDFNHLLKQGKKFILIDAPLGAGKTTCIKKTFYEDNPDIQNSLIITSQRSLVKKIVADIENVTDYEYIKKERLDDIHPLMAGHLASCLNSLSNEKIQKVLPEQLDLLFIDEIEHTLEAIFTGTVKKEKREQLLSDLSTVIKNAKIVVFAQYQITELTMEFLKYFGYQADDVMVLKNTYKRYANLPCHFYQHETVLVTQLHDAIRQGERCVVTSNSRLKVEELGLGISREFPKARVLKLTAKTADEYEVKSFLKNPTAGCEKYDLILFSPFMGCGFSLEHPDFKRTFGFFNSQGKVCSPSTCVQMSFRSRTVERLDYYVDTKNNPAPVDENQILNEAMKNFEFKNSTWVNGKIQIDESEEAILMLHSKVVFKDAKDKARYFERIRKELEEGMGCQVILEPGEVDIVSKEIEKVSKDIRKKLDKYEILKAEVLSEDDFDRKKYDASPAQVNRYRFEKTMFVELEQYPLIDDGDSTDEQVAVFQQYIIDNPTVGVFLDDFNEGKVKKPHLLISEACTSESDAIAYSKLLNKDSPILFLDSSLKSNFSLRWHLFNLLIPLIHLKRVNGNLVPVDTEKFSYADVLKDKAFMDFCKKHRDALQACNLSKFKGGTPTVRTIGYWVRDMGLSPTTVRVQINDGTICMKNWGEFDTPSTRLLARFNLVTLNIRELEKAENQQRGRFEEKVRSKNDGVFDDEGRYKNDVLLDDEGRYKNDVLLDDEGRYKNETVYDEAGFYKNDVIYETYEDESQLIENWYKDF